jgi:hypothetical protein
MRPEKNPSFVAGSVVKGVKEKSWPYFMGKLLTLAEFFISLYQFTKILKP